MGLLRKGILVSGVQMASIGCGTLAGIIFRRTLGPGGMGQYDLFRTSATLAVATTALGLGSATIYFLNNRKIELVRLASNSVKVGLVLGLLLASGLLLVVLTTSGYFGEISLVTALLFSLGAAVSLNVNLLRPILVAQLAARQMAWADISQPVFQLAAVACLALLGCVTTETAIIVYSLGGLCAYAVLMRFIRPSVEFGRPFEWRLLGDLIVYGVKLSAANVLYLLSGSITVLLLRGMQQGTFADVGLYASATALCHLSALVPTAVGPLLYAQWAGMAGAARARQAEMAARMNLAYGACAALLLFALGKWLLWLLYGPQFVPAYSALQILAPAAMLLPLFGVCNNLLVGDGRVAVSVAILCGTVLVVLVVAATTIPTLGLHGAALSVLCGNAFTAFTALAACRRRYGIRIRHCLLLTRTDLRHAYQSLRNRSAPARGA